MLAGFLAVMALSLVLAAHARRGRGRDARAFFTASGQFGAVLFFFLSVGETYSIASMLGFPGGVYASGEGFVLWFFGYILLAAPVIFVAGPWIWRAGRLYGAATVPDFFRAHYASRGLELVLAISSVLLLVPVGTMQFLGLKLVLSALVPAAPSLALTGMAGLVTFAYVALAGLRASAFVAVLKDALMLGTIVLVGGLALAHWPAGALPAPPRPAVPVPLGFALSTIAVQAAGFAMIPQNWAFIFSARSPDAIRRAQAMAPLYMVMFPLLMVVAHYARAAGVPVPVPDFVFLATARALLPPPVVGVVMAAVVLSGLVVMSSVCLAIGPLVTRNLLPGLPDGAQQRWARVVIAGFLALSLLGADHSPAIMAGLNNLFYFGVVQTLPGFIAALLLPRVPARALVAGLVGGDALVVALRLAGWAPWGLNVALPGLAANVALMALVTVLRPREGPSVAALLRGRGE